MTVGRTTTFIPSAEMAAEWAYSLATPRAVESWPSWASILSEGPFRDLPPTMGQTAKTFSLWARSWSRTWGTARIGQMLISGLLGQMMMRSASRMASRTPGAGFADSAPAKRMPRTTGSARRFTRYSWKWSGPSFESMMVGMGLSDMGRMRDFTRRAVRIDSAAWDNVFPSTSMAVRWMWVARSRSPRLNQLGRP